MGKYSELTEFQNQLTRRIQEVVEQFGRKLAEIEIGGEKESFVSGKIREFQQAVSETDLMVWVYRASAEFTNLKEVDCRYEACDYDSMDELTESYIRDLAEHLNRGNGAKS